MNAIDEIKATFEKQKKNENEVKTIPTDSFYSKENEKAISQNAYRSYSYARYVLKGRFELGEKAISKSASYSYSYARDVLKLT